MAPVYKKIKLENGKQLIISLTKAKRNLRNNLCIAASKCTRFEPLDNLIIFSDPRGGSTWITEVISQLPKTAILWEPLHLGEVDHFNKLDFGWTQYIPEQASWNEAKHAFDQLFKGKVLNNWTCSLSSPVDFLRSDRMVIKFCRANALVPWLTRVFDFKFDPVYLVRHPFAVVASQLQHGAWNYEFDGFVIPECPYNNLYVQHADFLSSLATKEEALVATWCLSNLVTLHNARNDKSWITVYYENILSNPEKELNRIFERWNLPVPENAMGRLQVPSVTTKEPTFQVGIEKQLSKWQSFFEQKQVKKLSAVLQYFGVKHYTTELFPRVW